MDEEDKLLEDVPFGEEHEMPREDYQTHLPHPSCWCQPEIVKVDLKSNRRVWLHKSAREQMH